MEKKENPRKIYTANRRSNKPEEKHSPMEETFPGDQLAESSRIAAVIDNQHARASPLPEEEKKKHHRRRNEVEIPNVPPRNEVKEQLVNPAKVFMTQETYNLLLSLYNNPRFSSRSKKRFYQAIKEYYPEITYEDVSLFMEMRIDYRVFKLNLLDKKKLTRPKSSKRKTHDHAPRQQKTSVTVMKPNNKWEIDITHPPISMISSTPKGAKGEKPPTLSKQNILTIIDVFSKYAFAFIIPDKSAASVASRLKIIFSRYRAPVVLLSDGGNEFVGEVMKGLLLQYQVKHIVSPPYTPLGIIERFNQTFKNMLAHAHKVTEGKIVLDLLIDQVLENYNSLPHSSHKHTPKEVHFSKDPLVRMNARKIAMGNYNKLNDKVIPYPIGVLVFIDVHDWPDMDAKMKAELFREGKINKQGVLARYGIDEISRFKTYKIHSRITIPKSDPLVYLYRVQNTGVHTERYFMRRYLHQQLIPV